MTKYYLVFNDTKGYFTVPESMKDRVVSGDWDRLTYTVVREITADEYHTIDVKNLDKLYFDKFS